MWMLFIIISSLCNPIQIDGYQNEDRCNRVAEKTIERLERKGLGNVVAWCMEDPWKEYK